MSGPRAGCHKTGHFGIKLILSEGVPGWLSAMHPTLDLGSGHDLRVVRSSPVSGSELGVESAGESLSLSLLSLSFHRSFLLPHCLWNAPSVWVSRVHTIKCDFLLASVSWYFDFQSNSKDHRAGKASSLTVVCTL